MKFDFEKDVKQIFLIHSLEMIINVYKYSSFDELVSLLIADIGILLISNQLIKFEDFKLKIFDFLLNSKIIFGYQELFNGFQKLYKEQISKVYLILFIGLIFCFF
jgi:hypothetical protein